jgi:TrmH family RNA methyltransferase
VDEEALEEDHIASLCLRATNDGVKIFSLATGTLEKVSDAKTPQPILAAVQMRPTAIRDLSALEFVLVLHDIRDPGNAGTIIRSADASGASAVILSGQSVDPYNPKTLRATAGSIFRVPVAVGSLEESLDHLKNEGLKIWATVVRDGQDARHINFTGPSAVVLGNEAQGLSDSEVALCDASLSIPMSGGAESLNAAIAGSLLSFAAFYQRLDTKLQG